MITMTEVLYLTIRDGAERIIVPVDLLPDLTLSH